MKQRIGFLKISKGIYTLDFISRLPPLLVLAVREQWDAQIYIIKCECAQFKELEEGEIIPFYVCNFNEEGTIRVSEPIIDTQGAEDYEQGMDPDIYREQQLDHINKSFDLNPTVLAAREFAIKAHGNQQKYGGKPYVYHLDMVADLVKDYGEQAQIIAYLHDVLEDTNTYSHQILEGFGYYVTTCVELLTDEEGSTRAERKAKTNRKLAMAGPNLNIALVVKAADRLANVTATVDDTPEAKAKYLKMYKEEHPEFKKAVYRPNICEDIWIKLNSILEEYKEGIKLC